MQDYERRWGEDPCIQEWTRCQDGQSILLATPSVLVGYRVQVYRAEGTTQWYTAVIVGYNESTRVRLLCHEISYLVSQPSDYLASFRLDLEPMTSWNH